MKFSVGYQMMEYDSIYDIVNDFSEKIGEVYFSWIGFSSARSIFSENIGYVDWSYQRKMEEELQKIKNKGIKLNLLFNSNCYGKESLSEHLISKVYSTLDYLIENVGLDSVTTTSPIIAREVKREFPFLEVRASVNMKLGTVKSLKYISNYFDGYYIQREYNRDFERIKELKKWCDNNSKKLYILVNSGCLSYCSTQTFHDNLVAHEEEISKIVNIQNGYSGICWEYLKDKGNKISFLQDSTWIRPEDINKYNSCFNLGKLATRVHSNPRKVVEAYVRGAYSGNLLDLFEPNHSSLLAPYIIDNNSFPKEWGDKINSCDKKCYACTYCEKVMKKVLKDVKYI
jgi:collagenase-like PrtC family protease